MPLLVRSTLVGCDLCWRLVSGYCSGRVTVEAPHLSSRRLYVISNTVREPQMATKARRNAGNMAGSYRQSDARTRSKGSSSDASFLASASVLLPLDLHVHRTQNTPPFMRGRGGGGIAARFVCLGYFLPCHAQVHDTRH